MAENKTDLLHSKNESFNVQGEEVDSVFCLAAGSAKVARDSISENRQSIVRIAAPGDLLGYRCIFSEEKFRATGIALEETRSCKISKEFILQLIENNSRLAKEMLKRMGQEIAAAENHHHSFCSKNVRERVAESLIILSQKNSIQTPRGIRIEIQLTRQEFANWVGTAKATLIRCLSDFKNENLIYLDEGYIVILNYRKLLEIANNNI